MRGENNNLPEKNDDFANTERKVKLKRPIKYYYIIHMIYKLDTYRLVCTLN